MINNKTILITGGTGSFGQAFIKEIYKKYKPKKVIVYSRDELKQFEMSNNFPKEKFPKLKFFIGDVRDKERLKQSFCGVDYVVHAAALKQVPVAEYNPFECIKTNILGAQNVIEASIDCKVKKVVALSTDKAADPVNLYGASKLASDKLFIAGNYLAVNQKTIFSVVRYGNVINSRGSVIPYFLKLVKEKSKFLPITDKNMTRFIITLQEGVNFVLKSFMRMSGGETFVPKLPSIRIVDLANVIGPDLKIKKIGLREGEKIHEIMCPKDYSHLTLRFKDHYVIKPTIIISDKLQYKKNKLGEIGKPVENSFVYSSETNKNFLSKKEIVKITR